MAKQWDDWAVAGFVAPWPNKVDGGVVKGRIEGGKAPGPGKGEHAKGKRKRAVQAAVGE